MNRSLRPLNTVPVDTVSVAPSILAADFTCLGSEISGIEAGGAEVVHIDVMDGHFVPNISMGPPVVKGIRGVTELPFDVHLMLTDPDEYIDPFFEAGADHITIHVEIDGDVRTTLQRIRSLGCTAGLSLRPGTPASELAPYLEWTDLILVMTVEPGFGGQSFREDMVPKIQKIREMISRQPHPIHLEVDGGIKPDTARIVVSAGANMLVAGTSVFRAPAGMAAAIAQLKSCV